MGFYPVTPGLPIYNIGSPLFEDVQVSLPSGKVFRIIAKNCSDTNKYIQSARLNGKQWNKPWFTHDDIKDGGTLELKMGPKPNIHWGVDQESMPPSADPLP